MELITTKNTAPERRETIIQVTIHLNCNATYVNVQINLFLNNVQFLIEKTNKPQNHLMKKGPKQAAVTGACLATLSVVPLKLKFYPPRRPLMLKNSPACYIRSVLWAHAPC